MPNLPVSRGVFAAVSSGLKVPTGLYDGVVILEVAAMSEAEFDTLFDTLATWHRDPENVKKFETMDYDALLAWWDKSKP